MAGRRGVRHNSRIEPGPLGVQPKKYGIYLAEVKRVDSSGGTGQMLVWMADSGTANDGIDSESWITVNYTSPFFGTTPLESNKKERNYEATQTSYGMWMVPPDVGNMVIIGFVNGDPDKGYCLGCVPSLYADRMVPGAASGTAYDDAGSPIQIPVPQAEHNKLYDKSQKSVNDETDDKFERPYSKYHAEGLVNQGLIEDDIRGTATASARRSSPSNSYGILTPGPTINPINNKTYSKNNRDKNDEFKVVRRKGGSSFVMDDEDGSESVRIRTRSGAQMLLDETEGLVYFINRDGTSWMEMDAEGNVDVFSAKSITMRAEENFNIRADKDITMEAGQNIFMKAAKDHKGTAGENPVGENDGDGGDIYFEARNDVLVFAKKNMQVTVEDENLDVNVKGTSKILSGGDIDIKTEENMRQESAGDFDIKVGGGLYQTATGDFNLATGADLFQESVGEFNIKSNTNIKQTGQTGVHISSLTETVIAAPDLQLNAGPADPADTATGALGADDATLITPLSLTKKINVVFDDLTIPIRKAINILTDKDREEEVFTLVKRWVTREPCPEKNHKKGE